MLLCGSHNHSERLHYLFLTNEDALVVQVKGTACGDSLCRQQSQGWIGGPSALEPLLFARCHAAAKSEGTRHGQTQRQVIYTPSELLLF